MPSARNRPPKKTEEITIIRGCVANGERTPVGATILVSPSSANLLVGSKLAVRGNESKAKKKTAKKVAKSKPPVDAQR
jgi:hypothetical protein